MHRPLLTWSATIALAAALIAGCTSSSATTARDTDTDGVGTYPPAPAGAWKPRLGVPKFAVSGGDQDTASASEVAADQLTTLCTDSERFRVIERVQLEQLLQEQGLAGVVKEGEVAKTGQVRGVDYLMIGKITNFQVKAEKSSGGFNLGSIAGKFGAFDLNNSKSVMTVECGVDLRVVDPASGEVVAAKTTDYKRTDSLSAFGVGVLGYRNEAKAELKIDKANQGKILRLALDETLRKMLPKLDKLLVEKGAAAGGKAP